ncbi:DUF6259 domain-containing protein [Pseudactinotalea suaedae]|uniref:DUF6259 domain-containing protein n=1 Tax=Pseudactinotalea suaedae TaxID=1524924 RepID=UPI0012E31269|nr:DUF6259 domain-containing protein [Pseudactinotalea suaedae]
MTAPIRMVNEVVAVDLDERGAVLQLTDARTGSPVRGSAVPADSWKLVTLTDGYPVRHIRGRDQVPDAVERDADQVTFRYDAVEHDGERLDIRVAYTVQLVQDEVRFSMEIGNGGRFRIREVWCPVLTGLDGAWGRALDAPAADLSMTTSNWQQPDVLHQPLARQEFTFNVDVLAEVAHYRYPRQLKMQWLDLSGPDRGLLLYVRDAGLTTTSFRIEKYPPEFGDFTGAHHYPEGTERHLTAAVQRLTSIDPGETWQGAPVVLHPHDGDWHAAASRYRAWARSAYTWCDRPDWLQGFTGFQHLLGKTHLNETYFTFDRFAETFAQTQPRDGINVLMTYGHEHRGCESADFDIQPAQSLGGSEGFAELARRVHAQGGRVMIMTHRHAALATDDPATALFADWFVVTREGMPRQEIWPKTSLESYGRSMLRTYEATGPIWQRVCAFSDSWWETFLDQLLQLIDLGLDGVQMDLMVDEGPICYATGHGHKAGAPEEQLRKLGERLAWLRQRVQEVNPDFTLMGEEFSDWLYQYLDVSFSRYPEAYDDRGTPTGARIFRYALPELLETCSVGAFAYDQLSKAVMTGRGFGVEVLLIKRPILDDPAFHRAIAEANALRIGLADLLMSGGFQDTDGLSIEGRVEHGVHRSAAGVAVVVANVTDQPQSFTIEPGRLPAAQLHRPGEPPTSWSSGPVDLEPHSFCVLTIREHADVPA